MAEADFAEAMAPHVPFETTKSGFYNIDKFSRYQTLHFAIGYPF